MKTKIIRILNAVFLALTIIFNYLVNKIPLFGITTGDVSKLYPTVISPAPYAFSIWGAIYLFLIFFVVYSFTPSGRKDKTIISIEGLFISSCILNMIWLVFWHALQITFSVGVMAALLICLCQLYIEIAHNKSSNNLKQKFFVMMPFSVYLSWICAATVSNVAAAIVSINPYLLSVAFWSIAMALFLVALAIYMGLKFNDYFFTLTMCWSTVAIGIKNISNTTYSTILFAASGILFIVSLFILFRKPRLA